MMKILGLIYFSAMMCCLLSFNGCATHTCYSGDCVNGPGTATYHGGKVYIGEWKDRKRNGQGTFTAYGHEYVGEWKNDKVNGQGTFTDADGNKYVGGFKDNNMHGQGTLTENGTKYVGGFKNNKMHGQGTFTDADGKIYADEYDMGKRISRKAIEEKPSQN